MTPTGKRNLFKRLIKNPRAGVRLARAKLSARYRLQKKFAELKKVFPSLREKLTISGANVEIFLNGFANPVQTRDPQRARPLVFTLVNGHVLKFYKSTGRQSDRPGEWLPVHWVFKEGYEKFADHPNVPEWVTEISRHLKTLEKDGKLRLQPKWDLNDYYFVKRNIFRKTPEIDPTKGLGLKIPQEQLKKPGKVFRFGKIIKKRP